MNIRDTDSKGFFKGEFDFAESKPHITDDNNFSFINVRDGIHTFLGKLNFEIYREKPRHPFRPEENRIYKGTLYIVDRLDFSFDDYKIDTFLRAEYDIIHYREMQTLKFTLSKLHKDDGPGLPKTFILYKKLGVSFEPYKSVRNVVFGVNTKSDK